tara:strand:- start:1984 stop:2235 length:252 start_codon:yes stop_codon:yes gene_type:complete
MLEYSSEIDWVTLCYCEQQKKAEAGDQQMRVEVYTDLMANAYFKHDLLVIFRKLNFKGFQNMKKCEIINFLYYQDFHLGNIIN